MNFLGQFLGKNCILSSTKNLDRINKMPYGILYCVPMTNVQPTCKLFMIPKRKKKTIGVEWLTISLVLFWRSIWLLISWDSQLLIDNPDSLWNYFLHTCFCAYFTMFGPICLQRLRIISFLIIHHNLRFCHPSWPHLYYDIGFVQDYLIQYFIITCLIQTSTFFKCHLLLSIK